MCLKLHACVCELCVMYMYMVSVCSNNSEDVVGLCIYLLIEDVVFINLCECNNVCAAVHSLLLVACCCLLDTMYVRMYSAE